MLDAFHVGEVYDLPAALATYLVITRSAVPADVSGSRFFPFETSINVSPPRPRAVAADRGARRKKTRRSQS
jgi:hypothetical protein